MTQTMTVYKTSEFEHKEVGHIFYEYTSKSLEYELAHKLCTVNNGSFIVIISNKGEPLGSLNC